MPSQEEKGLIENRRLLGISAICLIIGIILIAIGAKSLQPSERIDSKEVVVDYTYCVRFEINVINETRCIDYEPAKPECVCHHKFEVLEPLNGNVTLFYELDSTVQTGDSYLKSRDDHQLSGQLVQEPAEQCDPYRFDDLGKPIAPCGEIADTMFTDKYWIRRRRENYLNISYYGMIKDKGKFRNPPWNQSYPLKDVLKDFAKPKSWTQNVWELDTDNADNNGFENERFIGWMSTSMKRKPALRIDPSYGGLQNGTYLLRVEYSYPPAKYNGTRRAILVGSQIVLDYSSYGGGVAMVVFGVIFLALSLAMAAYFAMIYLLGHRADLQTRLGAASTLMN